MSVKDAVGSELVEGDLVLVQLDKPYCIGRISKMANGGLSLADTTGKGRSSPGMIQIVCPQTVLYQPGPHANVPVIFKLNNPVNEALASKLADAANLGEPAHVAPVEKMPTAKAPVSE